MPGVGQLFPLPHELAHCVVEKELQLQHGFWGCVAAGALFPGMTIVAGRQKAHAAQCSKTTVREMGQRGTEAEVLVGVLENIERQNLDNNWPVAQTLLKQMWRPLKPSRPLPDYDEVRRVCSALRDTQTRWKILTTGESLTIVWPVGKGKKK